jgi:hypothetical protein
MRLFHVTLKRNRASISRSGINPAYSQGARKECWYVQESKICWAFLHVSKRHKVALEEVEAYQVVVRPSDVTRRGRGVYTCPEVLRPTCGGLTTDIDDLMVSGYPEPAA